MTKLSTALFVEAISESSQSAIAEVIQAHNEGDLFRVGILIRDILNEYLKEDDDPMSHDQRKHDDLELASYNRRRL